MLGRQELRSPPSGFMRMNEVLKSLGDALRRAYNSVVQKPMPWRMIDKLATLDEACEQRQTSSDPDTTQGANGAHARPKPDGAGNPQH